MSAYWDDDETGDWGLVVPAPDWAHVTTTPFAGGGYRARCTCGWESSAVRRRYTDADDDATLHAADTE